MSNAREQRAGRIVTALWAATLALAALTSMMTFVARSDLAGEDLGIVLAGVISGVLYVSIGAIIVHRGRNAIGWILAGAGTGLVLLSFGSTYAVIGFVTAPGSLPAPQHVAAATSWLFVPVTTSVAFMLFVFPTGTLPSPRWRPIVWVGVAAAVVTSLGFLLDPEPIEPVMGVSVSNPFGMEALGSVISTVLVGSVWVTCLAVAASIVALVVRYRRGGPELRQQIKWLAFAAAFASACVVTALASLVACNCDESVLAGVMFFAFFLVLLLGVPAAIAIAVLKYGLFEIDVIISKTVVYGVLAAALTGLYVAIVVGIGAAIGQRGNSFLTIIAAGAVALAFQPLRRRAQRLANRIVYGERATPYQVLSDFAERMAGTYGLDEVLHRMAAILAEGTGATRVDVWLRVGGELRAAAAWPADAAPVDPIPLTPEGEVPAFEDATRAVAVRHGDELLGALTLEKPTNEPLSPTEDKLLDDLASQAGLVLRNVRLTAELQANVDELRASRRRLVEAQDHERRKIERNLHDGAQQQLVALSVQLGLLETMAGDTKRVKELTAHLQASLREALDDLRDLARGIYPPLLADKGLADALEAQARKAAIPTVVEPDGIGRYPEEVEAAVYFCSLEALQNVAKYAGASSTTIRLSDRDGELTFEIEDDGGGFDPSATGYGTGMQGMADRLDAIGGTLDVRSAPGSGTVVRGRIPTTRRTASLTASVPGGGGARGSVAPGARARE